MCAMQWSGGCALLAVVLCVDASAARGAAIVVDSFEATDLFADPVVRTAPDTFEDATPAALGGVREVRAGHVGMPGAPGVDQYAIEIAGGNFTLAASPGLSPTLALRYGAYAAGGADLNLNLAAAQWLEVEFADFEPGVNRLALALTGHLVSGAGAEISLPGGLLDGPGPQTFAFPLAGLPGDLSDIDGIRIAVIGTPGDDFAIAEVRIIPGPVIPEPVSLAPLGAAGLLAGAMRRRRRGI